MMLPKVQPLSSIARSFILGGSAVEPCLGTDNADEIVDCVGGRAVELIAGGDVAAASRVPQSVSSQNVMKRMLA